jgi:hypothetical protein
VRSIFATRAYRDEEDLVAETLQIYRAKSYCVLLVACLSSFDPRSCRLILKDGEHGSIRLETHPLDSGHHAR